MAMKVIAGMIIMVLLAYPIGLAYGDDSYPAYLDGGAQVQVKKVTQNGYGVEDFLDNNWRMQEQVTRRNETLQRVERSSQAAPISSYGIAAQAEILRDSAVQTIRTILESRKRTQSFAATNGEFTYLPKSDGSILYFTDGLVTTILKERVSDQFGNVSLKDSYNMRYDDRRLMRSYDTVTTDRLGNISIGHWEGEWTADSLWYADDSTNVHKNLLRFTSTETDHTGRTTTTQYQALQFDGRFVRAFSQTTHDSIYGDTTFRRYNIQYAGGDANDVSSYDEEGQVLDEVYTLHRSNIAYNDRHQVTGYDETKVITNLDGSKTTITTRAHFEYAAVANAFGRDVEIDTIPNRLTSSTMTTLVQNQDGSFRTSTETITYQYEGNQLVGGIGTTVFSGREANWIEHTDGQGHVLAIEWDEGVMVSAWYFDEGGNKVYVPIDQIQSAVKPGHQYEGNTITHYEVVGFTPMAQDSTTTTNYQDLITGQTYRTEVSTTLFNNGLVNNTPRLLSTSEHTESWLTVTDPNRQHVTTRDIETTYLYDINGNLTGDGAVGTGSGTIYDDPMENGWHEPRTVNIRISYGLFYGRPLQTKYEEMQTIPTGNTE